MKFKMVDENSKIFSKIAESLEKIAVLLDKIEKKIPICYYFTEQKEAENVGDTKQNIPKQIQMP